MFVKICAPWLTWTRNKQGQQWCELKTAKYGVYLKYRLRPLNAFIRERTQTCSCGRSQNRAVNQPRPDLLLLLISWSYSYSILEYQGKPEFVQNFQKIFFPKYQFLNLSSLMAVILSHITYWIYQFWGFFILLLSFVNKIKSQMLMNTVGEVVRSWTGILLAWVRSLLATILKLFILQHWFKSVPFP